MKNAQIKNQTIGNGPKIMNVPWERKAFQIVPIHVLSLYLRTINGGEAMYIISITQEYEMNPEDDKEHIVLTHSVTLDDIMTDIRGLLVSVGFSKELVDEYFDG